MSDLPSTARRLGQFPLVAQRPTAKAREIDRLTTLYANRLPGQTALGFCAEPSRNRSIAHPGRLRVRSEMIAWQEELDWEVYQYYGVLDEDLTYAGKPARGQIR
jgi:hypothetical protein